MTGEYDSEREMGVVSVTRPDAESLVYILARAPAVGAVGAHPTLRDSVTLLLYEARDAVTTTAGEVVQKFEGPEVDELTAALLQTREAAQPALDYNLIGNIDAYLARIPAPVVARCGGLALV